MTMLHEHYWELYLFFGMACILAVYLGVYFVLRWWDTRRHWRQVRQNKLYAEDATFYLKGYDASPRPNIRVRKA